MDADFPEYMLGNIERFLANDNTPDDLDLYPKVFEVEGFVPLQRGNELSAMLREGRSIKPKVVMEIGTDKGGGLYHWIKSQRATLEKVVAVEIRGCPYAAAFQKAFPDLQMQFHGGSSRDPDILEAVREFVEQIDVLFIDGDKSAFYADFLAYLPMMRRPGGLVFMHDIQDKAPSAGFASACLSSAVDRSWTIIDRSEGEEAAERKRNGGLPRNSHDGWLMEWAGDSCGVGVLQLG